MGQDISHPPALPTSVLVQVAATTVEIPLPGDPVTSGWLLSECLRRYSGPGRLVSLSTQTHSDVLDVYLQSMARTCDWLRRGETLQGVLEDPVFPPTSQSHFSFLQVIGRGGYSTVLKARKRDCGLLYAVKIMRKAEIMRAGKVPQVFTELSILAKVHHPFLIKLHYAFQSVCIRQNSAVFLVLDFCPGGELFHHLKVRGRLSEAEARFYFAEVLLALGYLHECDILYRDLKPENVLLDAEGHIVLTDFGVSREGVSSLSVRKSFCGSPEYMTPEMLRGAGYTRAVDFYSLGAFLYELLAGIPPFFHTNRTRMFRSIQNEDLTFPHQFSREACNLIARLMERTPASRLGSQKEVQLHPWCKGIDWDRVLRKDYDPPIKPRLRGSNFEDEYTSMEIEYPDEEVTEPAIGIWLERAQEQFQGFEYPKGENFDLSLSIPNSVPRGRSLRNDLSSLSNSPVSSKATELLRKDTHSIPPKKQWTDEFSVRSSLVLDCHSAILPTSSYSPTRLHGPTAVPTRPQAKAFSLDSPREWSESFV